VKQALPRGQHRGPSIAFPRSLYLWFIPWERIEGFTLGVSPHYPVREDVFAGCLREGLFPDNYRQTLGNQGGAVSSYLVCRSGAQFPTCLTVEANAARAWRAPKEFASCRHRCVSICEFGEVTTLSFTLI